MGRAAGIKPAMRLMTIVLSNGATLRVPSAAARSKPFIATQDLFQHNVWAVTTQGAEAAAASRMKQIDFSDYYKKFGAWDDTSPEEEQERRGSSTSNSSGGGRGSSGRRT